MRVLVGLVVLTCDLYTTQPLWASPGQDATAASLSHYHRATVAIREGDLDRAKTELRKAIELNPRHVLSRYNLGIIQSMEGRSNEAEASFLEVLSLDPSFSLAHGNLGILYAAQGKFDKAGDSFEAAVQFDPASGKAIFNLGTFYFQNGDLDRGAEEFGKIASMAPYVAPTYRNLGEIHLVQGRARKAQEALQKALDLGDNSWRTRYVLGRSYLTLHQHAAALEQFKLARWLMSREKRDPAVARELQQDEAEITMGMGEAYFLQAKLDEAKAEYSKLVEQGTTGTRSYFQLARISFYQNSYQAAENYLQKVLQRQPQHGEAYHLLGMVNQKQGNIAKAEEHLLKAVELVPTRAEAHLALGNLYMSEGKREEGEKYLAVFNELSSLQKELKDLEKRVAVEPQNPTLQMDLARLLYKNKRFEAAEKELLPLLQLYPDLKEAQELLMQIREERSR